MRGCALRKVVRKNRQCADAGAGLGLTKASSGLLKTMHSKSFQSTFVFCQGVTIGRHCPRHCTSACRWQAVSSAAHGLQNNKSNANGLGGVIPHSTGPPLAVELLTLTLEIVLELHDGTAQLPFDIGHRRPIVGLVLHAQLDHVHVA